MPDSPVHWTTFKGERWLWRSLPNGVTGKKTSVNLSTSSGQSRQRAHQKYLTGLCANTSTIQHTCHVLERNMNSRLTVYLCPQLFQRNNIKLTTKGYRKSPGTEQLGIPWQMKFSGSKCKGIPQPGCTDTLKSSKSCVASRERGLGFIAESLLKILSQGSAEVKKPNRNIKNEYRRSKGHDYTSVYFMVCWKFESCECFSLLLWRA